VLVKLPNPSAGEEEKTKRSGIFAIHGAKQPLKLSLSSHSRKPGAPNSGSLHQEDEEGEEEEMGTSLSGTSIRRSDKVKCICEVNYYCIPYFLFHPARKETTSKATHLSLSEQQQQQQQQQ